MLTGSVLSVFSPSLNPVSLVSYYTHWHNSSTSEPSRLRYDFPNLVIMGEGTGLMLFQYSQSATTWRMLQPEQVSFSRKESNSLWSSGVTIKHKVTELTEGWLVVVGRNEKIQISRNKRDTAKSGLWTLDSGLDRGLDYGLDSWRPFPVFYWALWMVVELKMPGCEYV